MALTGTEAQGTKQTLRARLRQMLREVDAEERRRRSRDAAQRLVRTTAFQRARAVMIFLPLAHEIDARPVGLRAWQEDKVVTVPLVSYQQKHMLPVRIQSLDEPMQPDARGVRTPRTGEPYPIDMVDLVVVPGLGFDEHGWRIGRGGGFYDRFLSQPAFGGVACGLAMEMQVLDGVPTQAHDVRLDMLATERRVVRFDRHAR